MPATLPQTGLRARLPLPDLLERGAVNVLRCPVYVDGALVAPSSATVTLVDQDDTAVVSAATATITSSVPTYSYTPPTSLLYGDGWTVTWAITVSGEVHTVRNEAMLVRARLACPVAVADLWRLVPALDQNGAKPITSLTADQQDELLEEAWITVQGRLLSAGRRPDLVIGAHALREFTAHTALGLLFNALATRLNEAYAAMAADHRALAEAAWGRVRLTYDNTGVADGARRAARPSSFWMGRG